MFSRLSKRLAVDKPLVLCLLEELLNIRLENHAKLHLKPKLCTMVETIWDEHRKLHIFAIRMLSMTYT